MTKQELIELILEKGNPTQKYNINRDILNIDKNSPDMLGLQEEILNTKEVQKILKKQKSDGWFGISLHGSPGTQWTEVYPNYVN